MVLECKLPVIGYQMQHCWTAKKGGSCGTFSQVLINTLGWPLINTPLMLGRLSEEC